MLLKPGYNRRLVDLVCSPDLFRCSSLDYNAEDTIKQSKGVVRL